MDFNADTSYLSKFSPIQLPVTVAMYGDRWAKTVMCADGIEDGGSQEVRVDMSVLGPRSAFSCTWHLSVLDM